MLLGRYLSEKRNSWSGKVLPDDFMWENNPPRFTVSVEVPVERANRKAVTFPQCPVQSVPVVAKLNSVHQM